MTMKMTFSRNEAGEVEIPTTEIKVLFGRCRMTGETPTIDSDARGAIEGQLVEQAKNLAFDHKITFDAALTEIGRREPELLWASRLPFSVVADITAAAA